MNLSHNKTATALAVGGCALVIGGALAYAAANRRRARLESRPPDSAPGRSARQSRFGDYAVVGKTVTINKPRNELYAFWRDFNNLPKFMENIADVRKEPDGTFRWRVAAPAGQTVTVVTEIVEERENELIAWRSTPASEIDTEGRVRFTDAPAGRGTQVEAIVAYKPPGGELGRLVARLFRREPRDQGRHEMKRFKMLMEAGEIATSRNTNTRAD